MADLHPAFSAVEDQALATTVLSRALAQGRLASAYLFEGPSGVGKAMVAQALAIAAIADSDEAKARRIVEGNHPDVRVFEPRAEGKRNIQVETLREEILPFASYAPFEANAAFLIFPQADVSFPEHPPESTNALLKSLEEPRASVHYVLLSERPDRLLPTIRSRCQRLRFGRLSDTTLRAMLQSSDAPQELHDQAIALADGSAERALDLANGEAESVFEWALRLDDALSIGSVGQLTQLAEELAKGELPLTLALQGLIGFYRDVSAASLGLDDLRFSHHGDEIRKRAERTDARAAATRVAEVEQALLALERNGNPQIVLDALLYRGRIGA